jgi:hypothetical protein
MQIEIGKSPDFVMKHGLMIINHRIDIRIKSDCFGEIDRSFSNSSLVMTCRQALDFHRAKSMLSGRPIELYPSNELKMKNQLAFEMPGYALVLIAIFPLELEDSKRLVLISYISDFFTESNSIAPNSRLKIKKRDY